MVVFVIPAKAGIQDRFHGNDKVEKSPVPERRGAFVSGFLELFVECIFRVFIIDLGSWGFRRDRRNADA